MESKLYTDEFLKTFGGIVLIKDNGDGTFKWEIENPQQYPRIIEAADESKQGIQDSEQGEL